MACNSGLVDPTYHASAVQTQMHGEALYSITQSEMTPLQVGLLVPSEEDVWRKVVMHA